MLSAICTHSMTFDLGCTHPASQIRINRKDERFDQNASIDRDRFEVNGLRLVVDSGLPRFRKAYDVDISVQSGW